MNRSTTKDFDSTVMELLQLLAVDAKQPHIGMAEHVDLFTPPVRDRVNRLREVGIICRFTVDIDRSLVQEGLPVLVSIELDPASAVDGMYREMISREAIEDVSLTASGQLVVRCRLPYGKVRDHLGDSIDFDYVPSFEVELLDRSEWIPVLMRTTLTLEYAECGNSVPVEGKSTHLYGTLQHFCCAPSEDRFVRRHGELRGGAGSEAV